MQDIKDKNITLPYGKSYSTAQDQQALLNAFKKVNPKLVTDLTKYNLKLTFAEDTPVNIPLQKSTSTEKHVQIVAGNVKYKPIIDVAFQVNNNWTQINAAGASENLPKTARMNFPPKKINGIYYAATVGNGLWRSSDGTTWKQVNDIPIDAKITYPPELINGILYVGIIGLGSFGTISDGDGLWTSTNGTTWTQVTAFSSRAEFYSPLTKIDETYYIATLGNGLWKIQ